MQDMQFVTRRLLVRNSRYIFEMNQTLTTNVEKKVPRLLLFDIDGTLTKSHYKDPVLCHPMIRSLSEGFSKDIQRKTPGIAFAGGTDQSIMREVLTSNGITEDNTVDYKVCVLKTLQHLPIHMKEGVEKGQNWWSALPNVHELLSKLSKLQDVQLALLTGNCVEAAKIKLESAAIDVSLFETVKDGQKGLLGAFGDDHEIRNQLVPFAQQRYSEYIGKPISPEDMIIIGDTPKDIACAHYNNVACVAVGTGPCSVDELSSADYLLKDGFVDLEKSIVAIRETQRRL